MQADRPILVAGGGPVGVIMALASCHFGLKTTGGAPGVGRAVNSTVVASAAGIFVLDYFISFLLG